MQQNYYYFVFVAVLCNFQNGESLPSPALEIPVSGYHATNSIETKQDFLESVYVDCTDNKSSVPCFKYKLFAFVDRILNKDELPLANGITVVKTVASAVDGAPRSLDKASEDLQQEKNGDVGSMLLKRVQRFLNTHTLKVDLRGMDIMDAFSRAGKTLKEMSESYEDEEGDDVEMARKKKGGKKGSKMMGHMLMMLKMKMLGLIPLLFGLIALMAGKALLLGKLALLLSLIVLLKKLLASHQKSVTYEIVSHPHSSGGHDSYSSGAGDYGGGSYGGGSGGSGHGSSSWGRSADAQSMAYSAYNKATDVKTD